MTCEGNGHSSSPQQLPLSSSERERERGRREGEVEGEGGGEGGGGREGEGRERERERVSEREVLHVRTYCNRYSVCTHTCTCSDAHEAVCVHRASRGFPLPYTHIIIRSLYNFIGCFSVICFVLEHNADSRNQFRLNTSSSHTCLTTHRPPSHAVSS